MPLILAIEPDRRQASQLAALVRIRLDAELVVADSVKRALSMIGSRLPDLILISPLLSAADAAALSTRLRQFDGDASHVRMLRIPALARPAGSPSTTASRRRRTGARSPGCDPSIFAAQISGQLERAAAASELDRTAAKSRGQAPVEAAFPLAAAPVVKPIDVKPIVEIPSAERDVEPIAAAPVADEAVVEIEAAVEVEIEGVVDFEIEAVVETVEATAPRPVEPVDLVEALEAADAGTPRAEAVWAVEAAVAHPDVVAAAAPPGEDTRELWSALFADDSRVWPRIEGMSIRVPQLFVPFERLEAWSALPFGAGVWPLLEGVPAHEIVSARQPAADQHDDLITLVAELRREIAALRMLHAEPAGPQAAAVEGAPQHAGWGVYGPDHYVVPALIARLDPPHDLPDDPPAVDRPS